MSAAIVSPRVRAAARSRTAHLAVAVFGVLIVLSPGEITNTDGHTMYSVAAAIVDDGTLSVPEGTSGTNTGADGRAYGKHGIGMSLLAVPAYAASKPIVAVVGHAEYVQAGVVSLLMPLIGALLVAALFALGRSFGARDRVAAFVAVGAVFGTFAIPYVKDFYSEIPVALGVVLCVERVRAERYGQAAAAAALAALVRPEMLLFAGMFVVLVAVTRGRTTLRATVPPVAAAVGVTIAYNLVRWHSLLQVGYDGEGFTTPFLDGVRQLLFSEFSVFIYAPVLLVAPFALRALFKRAPLEATLLAGNVGAIFVTSSLWHNPVGGAGWGPRLLLPAVIPVLAAIAPWASRNSARLATAAALLAVGFLVSASTIVVPVQTQSLYPPTTDAPGYLPAQVYQQARLAHPIVRYSLNHLEKQPRALADHRLHIATWQLGATRAFGEKAVVGALPVTVCLLILSGWAAWRLRAPRGLASA